jgi:hypothetical protein
LEQLSAGDAAEVSATCCNPIEAFASSFTVNTKLGRNGSAVSARESCPARAKWATTACYYF